MPELLTPDELTAARTLAVDIANTAKATSHYTYRLGYDAADMVPKLLAHIDAYQQQVKAELLHIRKTFHVKDAAPGLGLALEGIIHSLTDGCAARLGLSLTE